MIKTKVFETKLIPKESNIAAITLFGLVFTRNRAFVNKRILNHELIHCQQQLEWLYIPFFIIYLAEWLWHYIRLHDSHASYRAISFEREAYENDHDFGYLRRRKLFQTFRKP